MKHSSTITQSHIIEYNIMVLLLDRVYNGTERLLMKRVIIRGRVTRQHAHEGTQDMYRGW